MKGSAILTLFLATVVTCAPVGRCPVPEKGSNDVSVGPFLADERNPSVFYECINGGAIESSCGPGLYFDAASISCVTRTENFGNGPVSGLPVSTPPKLSPQYDGSDIDFGLDTDIDTDNSVDTETTEGRDPIKGRCVGTCPTEYPHLPVKHLPHESDCTLFCKCNHGKPVLFLCPDGLYFNRYLEVCDWPAHSRCSNKQPK